MELYHFVFPHLLIKRACINENYHLPNKQNKQKKSHYIIACRTLILIINVSEFHTQETQRLIQQNFVPAISVYIMYTNISLNFQSIEIVLLVLS